MFINLFIQNTDVQCMLIRATRKILEILRIALKIIVSVIIDELFEKICELHNNSLSGMSIQAKYLYKKIYL